MEARIADDRARAGREAPPMPFEDFIAAVARGGQPSCDGAQGRASVAVIDAIYRSSSTNQPVEL